MGGLASKVKAMDPDNVFAYSTLKIVTIRDRRLGILHYAFQLAIFIYIIVYTIIIEQRYLKTEAPFGAIRSTVREPSLWPNATQTPYCLQNQGTFNGRNNYNCAYMLGRDLSYPAALMDSVFVTTRIKDTYYAPPPAGCDTRQSDLGVPTDIACAPSSTATTEYRYFIPGIEDYTVYIEHAIYGQVTDIAATNGKIKGTLNFNNGKKKPTELALEGSQYRRGTGDVFPLSTLLKAAGIDSLDSESSVNAANSKRYDGVLILAFVSYSNRASDSAELKYHYDLNILPGVDVISQEPSMHINGSVMSRSRYGVRFLFLVGGSIGKFDFPTLLSSIIAGMVLLKVATTIVDLLLLYVMPQKLLYKQHKFELTEDFSDVRDREQSKRNLGASGAGGADGDAELEAKA